MHLSDTLKFLNKFGYVVTGHTVRAGRKVAIESAQGFGSQYRIPAEDLGLGKAFPLYGNEAAKAVQVIDVNMPDKAGDPIVLIAQWPEPAPGQPKKRFGAYVPLIGHVFVEVDAPDERTAVHLAVDKVNHAFAEELFDKAAEIDVLDLNAVTEAVSDASGFGVVYHGDYETVCVEEVK